MTWSEIAVVVVVVLALLLWWVWVVASRLDRLHRKVASSRAALENQLVRRASVAAELAAAGSLDPPSAVVLADAAWSALSAGGYGEEDLRLTVPDLGGRETVGASVPTGERAAPPRGGPGRHDPCAALSGGQDRQLAESGLSLVLREIFPEPSALPVDDLGAELVEALVGSWYRVQLARRFHNESVAQARRVRGKPVVRLLHLAGHAAMPRTVDLDDGWPDGLPRPGQVG